MVGLSSGGGGVEEEDEEEEDFNKITYGATCATRHVTTCNDMYVTAGLSDPLHIARHTLVLGRQQLG
jgi:hypothetical protein